MFSRAPVLVSGDVDFLPAPSVSGEGAKALLTADHALSGSHRVEAVIL